MEPSKKQQQQGKVPLSEQIKGKISNLTDLDEEIRIKRHKLETGKDIEDIDAYKYGRKISRIMSLDKIKTPRIAGDTSMSQKGKRGLTVKPKII